MLRTFQMPLVIYCFCCSNIVSTPSRLFADIICKQFGHRSGRTKCLARSRSKLFDTNGIPERIYYLPTKSEGYSFGIICASFRPFRPSVHTFCPSGTISQYLLVRFDSFLVQMISTMASRYPLSLVKIDPLTLELLPLFWYRQF